MLMHKQTRIYSMHKQLIIFPHICINKLIYFYTIHAWMTYYWAVYIWHQRHYLTNYLHILRASKGTRAIYLKNNNSRINIGSYTVCAFTLRKRMSMRLFSSSLLLGAMSSRSTKSIIIYCCNSAILSQARHNSFSFWEWCLIGVLLLLILSHLSGEKRLIISL